MNAEQNRPLLGRIHRAREDHGQSRADRRDDHHDPHQTVDAVHEAFDEHDRHGDAQHGRDGHAEAEADDVGGKHIRDDARGVRGKTGKTDRTQPGRRHGVGRVQNLHDPRAADKVRKGGDHQQNFAQHHD